MIENSNFVIHVGFSKTGTTTLQKHLFINHPEIKYLGKVYSDPTFKDLLHRLIMQESVAYDPKPLINYVEEKQLRRMEEPKKVVILSDEMFLSYSKARDKGMVAHRLKEVFGPCRIVFTIRNQYELLKSAYFSRGRMMVNVPGKYDKLGVTFEDWLTLSLENYELGYVNHADFYKTIRYYSGLFGKENVCVMMLEEFINRKENYLDKLTAFLGIRSEGAINYVSDAHEHKEISQSFLDLELMKARLVPFHRNTLLESFLKLIISVKNRNGKNTPACVEIPSQLINPLKDIFAPGNRKLIEEFELPLENYGYPL